MGMFYENITLRGPEQQKVVDYLSSKGRNAFVAPPVNGNLAVFVEGLFVPNYDFEEFTADLSKQFACPALTVHLHDDDVLFFVLYQQGEKVDEYNSKPAYFGDLEQGEEPSGGHAELLCATFGVPDAVETVEAILRESSTDEDWVDEQERHTDLIYALGLPAFTVYAFEDIHDAVRTGISPAEFEETKFRQLVEVRGTTG